MFIIGIILNIYAVKKVSRKAKLRLAKPYTPLPDVIHDSISSIPIYTPDILLFISGVSLYFNNLVEIEKNLSCMAICIIIRSISIGLTIFPTCVPRESYYSTHDLMFSGHSILFICIGNMLNSYFIKIIGPLLLVISRQHYTIDVCVSGLVYFTVYYQI